MKGFFSKKVIVLLVLAGVVGVFVFNTHSATVDYNTEVKPIFNKNCISCHGGVRRKAGFSLLFRSEALANTESGKPAIIPGDPDHSEMIRRLTLKDPEERMPYKHAPLSAKDISILRDWVKQGAQWGEHWAYTPLQPVAVPGAPTTAGFFSSNDNASGNAIDRFIEKAWKEKGLRGSEETDKATLLRRVSLDLNGMPPSDKIIQQYFADKTDKAYENLVDSLLAAPQYGERWAAMWMDLARYADTKGYERDDSRTIWRYRDWLIKAFNKNMPYDQFLTEQIAGDLLPNPDDAQLIATAFHRNTMTNDEGGTDNEEFRTAAVLDRVNTTWEALMGTTFACVQCHSHPYDPFTHDEYYKFLAFFNNTRDEDTYAEYPLLRSYPDSAAREKQQLMQWLGTHANTEQQKEIDLFLRTWQPAINSLACVDFVNATLSDTKWAEFRNHGVCHLPLADISGKTSLIYRYSGYTTGGVLEIHADSAKGKLVARLPMNKTNNQWQLAETTVTPLEGKHALYFVYSNPSLKKQEDAGGMFDWFYFTNPFPGKGEPGYEKMKKRYWGLASMNTPVTPVMLENPSQMKRMTHVFERGNWLVKGAEVEPATPHALNPMPADVPKNRLGLAKWMTSDKNPLVARTMVNRLWEQLFGTGLAETLEDLGTQGLQPTHPELLNWLSYQFMHAWHWDIKRLLKEMVMSATYRQDARINKEALEKDPFNRYFARGPRVRLSAEQLRDQALRFTGMLSDKMYGPSVMPWQPDGIWRSPYDGATWKMSKGNDQYRRGLYTYWKRTAPYPAMITFDGVAREVCTARRIRTNTPLQALASLNDEAYLDLARHFASQLEERFPGKPDMQIRVAYERATLHAMPNEKLQTLQGLYQSALQQLGNNNNKACEMAGSYQSSPQATANTAALVTVINAIMNLDEVVTKN